MNKFFLLIIPFLSLATICKGQLINSQNKIIKYGVIIGEDTLPHTYLQSVTVLDKYYLSLSASEKRKYNRKRNKRRKRYSRLKRNVYKTYPYAVKAGFVMFDIDSAMQSIRSKDARKIYKKRKEKELMLSYKGQLENLTMSQGKVLVILIARETGKDCYSIIKELKGGFNARMWQTLATLFSNNLKRQYDPEGKDATIEMICQEIEAKGKYIRTNS